MTPPPFSIRRAAAAAPDPATAVAVTIHGAAGSEARKRWNDAIIAIMKSSGGNWHVSFSTAGGKTIFRVAPVDDPGAFADKIDFGKVTRVEGRSIDVEPNP